MGSAAALWLAVFIYLLQFENVPARTFLSTLFFVVFFALSVVYYGRTAIYVDSRGVTYRGILHTSRFTFGEIGKVDILPGPITVYSIRAKGRLLHFTSLFKHHRELFSLLVDRAGLSPMRSHRA